VTRSAGYSTSEFDPDTGSVTGLFSTVGRVGGGRLVGCGSYAAVVRME
jgi:hypothetical protein